MPREKKNPVTPPGIDPGSFRLVAQCLNHYATPGPVLSYYLRFMPYLQRPDKTHDLQVMPVYFTTETIRRILNMTSGVKFEYNLSFFLQTRYGLYNRGIGVRFPAGTRSLSLFHSVQTYLGPIRPYPQGAWVSKPARKSAGA
jgi:hypothetical protein